MKKETASAASPNVDDAIVALLRDDGQMTNVEIARRLSISEGSVRVRLGRLLETRAIRIGFVADLTALGFSMVSMVRMAVHPSHLQNVLEMLTDLEDVAYVAHVTGRFNVFAYVRARSVNDLTETLEGHFHNAPGIIEIEVRQVAEAMKFNFDETVIRSEFARGGGINRSSS